MRYDWTLLDAGPIALDGGGMFGVVPRVLWQKSFPPDETNRITLGHNCLLLRPADLPDARPVLIETGSGDKFDAKMRAIFGLGDRTILTALQEQKVGPADVGHVVVTHLHFDHAGGLTRLAADDEEPDWTGDDGLRVMRSFPNARIYVQRREWDDALLNNSVMTKTYLPEHLLPIEPQLKLLETPPPFPAGFVPRRDERPPGTLAGRSEEVLPGLSVFNVPGHTWGQQAVLFTDARGRQVCFVPDVMPTVAHAGPAYSLAFDVEPYTSSITRQWLLAEAAAGDWRLVLDHEPNTPVVTVVRGDKGFSLVPTRTA